MFFLFLYAAAEKETLAGEPDRKTAPPTESAVAGEAVKGTLRSRYAEGGVGISVRTRYVQIEGSFPSRYEGAGRNLNAGGTAGTRKER